MDFRVNRNKQLAAAVTLAVVGTAWVAGSTPVYAAYGSQTNPVQQEEYLHDLRPGEELAKEEQDQKGTDVYVAAYHENFNNTAYAAFGEMRGKTLTINNITVNGITGASGDGAHHGQDASFATNGLNGGIGYIVGIQSSNLSNSTINFAGTAIMAIGGAAAYDASKAAGQSGVSGASGTDLIGGAAAAGGNGGNASAVAADIKGGGNVLSGQDLTITATGADGAQGGTGGNGAKGQDGLAHSGHAADGAPGTTGTGNGTNGGNGSVGTGGATGNAAVAGGLAGNGAAAGNGGNAEATGFKFGNSDTLTTVALGDVTIIAAAGNGGYGGNGGIGGAGSIGGAGQAGGAGGNGGAGANATSAQSNGGDAGAAANGGNGGNGATGGVGGNGGNGNNGGNGGNATALAMQAANSKLDVTVGDIVVSAAGGAAGRAGIGGAGGTGGTGGAGGAGGNGGQGGSGGAGTGLGSHGSNSNNASGGNGGTGGTGGAGGAAGSNGTNGTAGNAFATGFSFNDSEVTLVAGGITVQATAGDGQGAFKADDQYKAEGGTSNVNGVGSNIGTTGTNPGNNHSGILGGTGGTGGAGGNGYTPGGKIEQTVNGTNAIANAIVTEGGKLTVSYSSEGNPFVISAEADNASVTNRATAIQSVNTESIYIINGEVMIGAVATGDMDRTDGNYGYDAEGAGTNATEALAAAIQMRGGNFALKGEAVTIGAEATEGDEVNFAQGIFATNSVVTNDSSAAADTGIYLESTAGPLSVYVTAGKYDMENGDFGKASKNAIAEGIQTSGADLTAVSKGDIVVGAFASNGYEQNFAGGIMAGTGSSHIYSAAGEFAVESMAVLEDGKGDSNTAQGISGDDNSSLKVLADGAVTIGAMAGGGKNTVATALTSDMSNISIFSKDDIMISADAFNTFNNGSAEANTMGIGATGGEIIIASKGTLDIEAASEVDDGADVRTATADAILVDGTKLTLYSEGAMTISAEETSHADSNSYARGVTVENNIETNFLTKDADITITGGTRDSDNADLDPYDDDYAVKIDSGVTTFDAGAAQVTLNGATAFTGGVLNLKSDTSVLDNDNNYGVMDLTGTRLNLTDHLEILETEDTITLDGSKIYFYDEKNLADKYNGTDYRTIDAYDIVAKGTNEFFMRTDANNAYGQGVGNDKIISYDDDITGGGTYDITVFDQGMRNGYNNAAGAAGKGHLNGDVKLIENADAAGTYNIKEMQYDNGVWAYEYEGKAEVDAAGNLNLTSITTKAAVQSSAQMAAQDANKIAAGAAVTLFGADETLMERLGDVRSGDDNDGVWAKYVGGKIKVDSISGDNDFKYNGFAAGYDHEIGNDWRIGLAGQYAKGDTTLTNGDGEIKTAVGALYGTWTGEKGHHVDIIAKVGKVDSETSAYGGTITQKLDGDFSSTAMSFAVEYGYRQDLKDGWFVEPMVRASYVHLGGDDYTVTTRDNTMNVTNDAMNSIVLRGGFLLGKTFAEASNVYLKAAVLHDFDGDINTSIKGDGRSADYSDSIGGTAIEYGIGVNHKFNKDSSMYFDVERISGGDVTKNWGVNVGFRYSF